MKQHEICSLWISTSCSNGIIETGGYYCIKCRYPLLTGVAPAPAVILGSVDEVNVSIGTDAHWSKAAHLGVWIKALNDEHHVINVSA